LVRNPFIIPPVPIPIAVSVVSSPTWVYIKIKTWNIVIITPAPVIIKRAIPTPFPRTPPPAIVEEDVHVYIRDDIDIRIRQHDQLRRCGKRNRRRKVSLQGAVGFHRFHIRSQCLFLGRITHH
jgi:hypothetical protein